MATAGRAAYDTTKGRKRKWKGAMSKQVSKETKCLLCSKKMSRPEMIEVHYNFNHEDQCVFYKNFCPNNCDVKEKVLWVDHKDYCLERRIPCPYKTYGCISADIPKKNMADHIYQDGEFHARLVMTKIESLKKERDTPRFISSTAYMDDISILQSLISAAFDFSAEQEENMNSMREQLLKLSVALKVSITKILEIDEGKRKTSERLNNIDQHLKAAHGRFLWTVNFSDEAESSTANSDPFYITFGGYKAQLNLYFSKEKGHLSIYLQIIAGDYDRDLPWPFQQNIRIVLLDQENLGRDFSKIMDIPDGSDLRSNDNKEFGFGNFIEYSELKTTKSYLALNNQLLVECVPEI